MSNSIQEEILAALYMICALLAFGLGFDVWGWIFSVKAAADTWFALKAAIKELRDEKRGEV